ncbi:hypothetical protein CERSUDRAFT_117401 [Gelatoporia subvermispora B]|uniref:Uncharacterized protein n=1 Tax=Ceriporiopsis subvermispora (strain B) TaxID=914234 RepID=M2QNZ6_CERS8|nr:hypothetical protein CERSUDRAFT_117401 [Gelatoporia subvermispora B]
MATPSSSATTPSPQLRHTTVAPPAGIAPNGVATSSSDREERERAIQKFLARAEIAKLTRGLRTRLSYATYKATHNLSHNTLHDLEAQAESQEAQMRPLGNRPVNHFTNSPAQGPTAAPTTPGRTVARKGSMAPPPPVTASATHSLFSSILAPPPAKRARTIHNPDDPPVPAPTKAKPAASPSRKHHGADGSYSRVKERKVPKHHDKGKSKQAGRTGGQEVTADVDIDMKAAATLTSLLLSSRPSISANTSSPRSSVSTGSDMGSTQSYQHFVQSSSRTGTAATSLMPSAESSFVMRPGPSTTPPPPTNTESGQGLMRSASLMSAATTTPKGQARPAERVGGSATPHPPSDTEAADLMLFLATSPSPVRPTTRDPKDVTAYRSLGGGSGLKGRVLFSGGGSEGMPSPGRPLRRDEGSFSSTTSIRTEPASGTEYEQVDGRLNRAHGHTMPSKLSISHAPGDHLSMVPMEPTIIPPTPIDAPAQLLPAPPSPSSRESSQLSQRPPSHPQQSLSSVPDAKRSSFSQAAPPTPQFNFNDFINVSPSPAAGPSSRLASSLHPDFGRRLFEEHAGLTGAARGEASPARNRSSLGAGIDLVQS